MEQDLTIGDKILLIVELSKSYERIVNCDRPKNNEIENSILDRIKMIVESIK